MANNYSHKQLKGIASDISKVISEKKKNPTENYQEVKDEWNRLATFMQGVK